MTVRERLRDSWIVQQDSLGGTRLGPFALLLGIGVGIGLFVPLLTILMLTML